MKSRQNLTVCFILFLFCLLVYLSNNVTISTNDTVPNTLLAFNLLENHTISLDVLRNSYLFKDLGTSYSLVEAANGHLTSVYPIGVSIVTFPIYFVFYIFLKLSSIPTDIVSQDFEVHRILFEKISATIITSLSVVLFYLSSRLKFGLLTSLISTFIFAFCTNTWMTSSQGLWQHGTTNFLLLLCFFCLLKSNRQEFRKSQWFWLLLAGLSCGMLPVTRPTSMCFWVAIVVVCVFIHRWRVFPFLLGTSSSLIGVFWNFYFFGGFSSGYSASMFSGTSPYSFEIGQIISGTLGVLISPSRGLFFFSPVLLFCFLGARSFVAKKIGNDEKVLLAIGSASVVLICSYFFYVTWWAGHSYGPRFMTDALPGLVYLLNYFVADIQSLWIFQKNQNKLFMVLFAAALSASLFAQAVGAYGSIAGRFWNIQPLNVDSYPQRVFNLSDNQIQRNFNAVVSLLVVEPSLKNPNYLPNLAGEILNVLNCSDNQCFDMLSSGTVSEKRIFKAYMKNIGSSRWYGNNSALRIGEVRVRLRFLDFNDNVVEDSRLYIVDGPVSLGDSSVAIAEISLPEKPGKYSLIFDLVSEGIAEFPATDSKAGVGYRSKILVR